MKGFGIGVIFSVIVKITLRVLDVLMYIIADLMIYFGLWIPSVYMLFAGGFMLFGKLDVTVLSTASVLFYVGLTLALAGSLIITIRNLVVKPIKEQLKYRARRKEYKANKTQLKREKLYQKRPDKYFAKYEDEIPPIDHPVYNSTRKDRTTPPHKAYFSKQNPDLLIHEYDDKYVIYEKRGNQFYEIGEKEKINGKFNGNRYSTAKKKRQKYDQR